MGQVGINVSPGTDVQIAVTPTIIGITKDAEERFEPTLRECYMPEEVRLPHLPPTDFRYQVLVFSSQGKKFARKSDHNYGNGRQNLTRFELIFFKKKLE